MSSEFWIIVMAFLVALSCGLIGNYLVLRRLALVGDAISHSVLPGIAIAFLFSNSLHSFPVFLGAMAAGVVTSILIEFIHGRSRIKEDAAIGITFSTLFAIGVIIISTMAEGVDLDADCVLHGNIESIPFGQWSEVAGLVVPESVLVMAGVTAAVILLLLIFYKELLVTSFDAGLAASLGISPGFVHYALMSALSVVVVAAFQAVGAVLVIAMLILPGATAYLLCGRLSIMLLLSVVHAFLSAYFGYRLAEELESSIAGSVVVVGSILFALAWMFHRPSGLVWLMLRRFRHTSTDAGERESLSGGVDDALPPDPA